jgi:hypothetical protein
MKECNSDISLQIMESDATFTPQRPSRPSDEELVVSTPVCWSAPRSSAFPPPALRVERRCREDKGWLTEYAPRMPGTSDDDDDDWAEEASPWPKRFYRYHIPPCFSPSIVTIHRAAPLPLEESKAPEDLLSEVAFCSPPIAPRMPFLPAEEELEEVLPPPLRLPDAALRRREWRES